MSSYTLTFKKKVFLTISLIFVFLILFNLLLEFYVNLKTTKDSYIGKFSKIEHAKLNNTFKKDIIFIGSSKTYYSISTSRFKDNDIQVYNLGIPGLQLADFPSLVDSAIDLKPKSIVISLPITKFYTPFQIPKEPSFSELSLIFSMDIFKFISTLYSYIQNKHTLLKYSETLYDKILNFYNKFNFYKIEANNSSIKNLNNMPTKLNLTNLDCKAKTINQNNNKHIRVKCQNGDGVLIGSIIEKTLNKNKETLFLKELNKDNIFYLKKIVKKIIKNKINVQIILEPMFLNYNYKKINIFEDKRVKVLDATKLFFDAQLWADENHFNSTGRQVYSDFLIEELKNYYKLNNK